MPRPGVLAALFLLLPAPFALAAQDPPAGGETALAERLEELCSEIDRRRAELHVPGVALAVVQDGEVVLARGFGLANLEAERAVTPETLFAIGSSTKAFTATLIGMLADEGVLGWDDAVSLHLPWFTPKLDAEEGAVLTLRDLLCHRSGFTRMSVLWAGNAVPRETVLRTAAGAEPWDGFRKNFHYCNVGYLAAGEAAAAAAGSSWDELVLERILLPLEMRSSTTSVAAARKDERLASGYAWREARGEFERLPMRELDAIAPAGAINSNVLDMARWVRFQLGRGELDGERRIRAETLLATWEPQIEIAPGVEYALGWMVREWKGRRVLEHGGNIDGFAAQVAFLPDDGIGLVLLANVTMTPLQAMSVGIVCEALLGEKGDPAAVAEAALDLAEYEGIYIGNFAQFKDTEFTVLSKDGRLALDVPGQMVFELEPPDEAGRWSFVLPVDISVEFERDGEGKVFEMIIHQAGHDYGLPRKGVEIAPEVPLGDLERYLGTYRDPALDAEVTVLIQNNRLSVDVPGQMVYELRPPDEEGIWRFRITTDLALEFHTTEETGEVDSFTFHERGTKRLVPRVAKAEAAAFGLEDLLALRRPDERRRLLEEHGPTRIRARVHLVNSGLEGSATFLVDGADRHRIDIDFGAFGRLSVAVDGDGGWTDSSFYPFRRLEGEELALARAEHPWSSAGDWTAFFDVVHVVRAGEHEGRPVHVVRLEREGMPAHRYHVDAETGDVLRVDGWMYAEGAGKLPAETVHSDFRDVAGVRHPFRTVTSNDATGRTVFEIEAIERLETADEGSFEPPGDSKSGGR